MFRNLLNKAKRKLHLHQSGALKECKPSKHIDKKTLSVCSHADCEKQICDNCQIEAPNSQFYCMSCFTTKPGLQQTLVTIDDEDEDEDGFTFDKKDGGSNFTKVGIQIDKQTGAFIGVDKFYAMVENSNTKMN